MVKAMRKRANFDPSHLRQRLTDVDETSHIALSEDYLPRNNLKTCMIIMFYANFDRKVTLFLVCLFFSPIASEADDW